MFIHYLITAIKNIYKYKESSVINILGLAFALVCFVPIVYWMNYETSYDSFYPDSSSIYRVYSVEKQTQKTNKGASREIEKQVCEQVPEVESSTAFMKAQENCKTELVPYVQLNMLYTDSTFLNVFPQAFVCGEIFHPLQQVNHLVLRESMAIRLFGSAEKAIGQSVQTLMRKDFPPYTITAVVKDPPRNTNLSFDALVFHNMIQYFSSMPAEAQWNFFFMDLYVKLRPRVNPEAFTRQIHDLPTKVGVNKGIELYALPLCDVRHQLDKEAPFTLNFISLFVISGALLMFAALFNFLNSFLDLFRQRTRELRLRVVNGATRKQLTGQLFVELGCSILIAILIALFFLEPVQPFFARLLDIEVERTSLFVLFCQISTCVFLCMELLAWLFFRHLSREAVSPSVQRKIRKPLFLRRVAVTLQMMISILFIVGAWVVMQQLRFIGDKSLGFESEGLVQLSGFVDVSGNVEEALVHELKTMPQIQSITDASFRPQHHIDPITTFSSVEWDGKSQEETSAFSIYAVDENFSKTFGLNMYKGKWWNQGSSKCVVLNEEAVRIMGLKEPVGSFIRMPSTFDFTVTEEYEVIGVVNDFHALSFRERIMPMIFVPSPALNSNLYLRILPGEESTVIKRIQERLAEIDPTLTDAHLTPVRQLYDKLNQSEIVGLKIFSLLAFICLLISLFGIYAMVSTSTKRRRKEIAIRKVVGAEASVIVHLFIREYAKLVLAAGLIAFPVSYLIMNYWLQSYAYRIQIAIGWLIGIFVIIIAMVLATIWKQVLKAANENPANVVKNE